MQSYIISLYDYVVKIVSLIYCLWVPCMSNHWKHVMCMVLLNHLVSVVTLSDSNDTSEYDNEDVY